MRGSRSLKSVITGLLLATAFALCGVHAKETQPARTSAAITVSELPPQGAQVYQLIGRGGPFPYEKDGSVFGNRERLLPLKQRGYYREYTVTTPGVGHRGTRRIVCGGAPRKTDECYYTADHYASFRRIVP